MSERKVLNKYYPPDFDPSKVPRGKRNKNATFNIRIMAPFNMRCNMCKEYIYKGKKFNSRKEDVMDEDYLGLRIFRFYIKCPRCVSEIAFKTDLKNTDYALEAGATRLFEAEKIAQQMAEQERKEKEDDELNPMKVLENRTKQSQMEMEQIDSLEEIREMNTRKNAVNTDEMIEKYRKYEELLQQLQMEEEEKQIQEIFGAEGSGVVKRLHDSDSEGEDEPKHKTVRTSHTGTATDILTGNQEKKATKTKAPAVWEKSVGSMSSKTKLSGLVIKKKSTKLPSFSISSLSESVNKASPSNVISDHSSTDAALATSKDVVKSGTSNTIDGESSQSQSNKVQDSNDAAASKVVTTVQRNGPVNSTKDSDKTSVKPTSLGGLGLLGAYSDSESDTSE